jgi:hypothetical protein
MRIAPKLVGPVVRTAGGGSMMLELSCRGVVQERHKHALDLGPARMCLQACALRLHALVCDCAVTCQTDDEFPFDRGTSTASIIRTHTLRS